MDLRWNMYKKILSVVILLITPIGCATVPPEYKYNEYLENFAPYVGKFRIKAYTYNRTKLMSDVIIYFGEVQKSTNDGYVTVAMCDYKGNIIINKKEWNQRSTIKQENVIFHEMGHCVLNRDHTQGLFEDDCPKSIMYPSLMTDWCYLKRYDYYMKELFQ